MAKRPNKAPKTRDTLVARKRAEQDIGTVGTGVKTKAYDRAHLGYTAPNTEIFELSRRLSPFARRMIGLDPFAMQRFQPKPQEKRNPNPAGIEPLDDFDHEKMLRATA